MGEPNEAEQSAARPTLSRGGRAAARWGRLACLGAALALALGEIAGLYWPFNLITPYTPQYAAIGMIGVLLVALATARVRASVDRVCLIIGLVAFIYGGAITFGRVPGRTIAPAPRVVATDADLGRVKVFVANVHTANTDHKTVLDLIAEEDPDVIFLSEVGDRWAEDLRALNEKYPTRTTMPDSVGNFGVGFWSRLPGEAALTIMKDPDPLDATDVPQVDATLTLTDSAGRQRPVRFIGLHPLPPISPKYTHARDAVLTRTAETVAARPGVPTIVAGDLNATRYCHIAQRLADGGKLFDAAAPLRFSWPNTWSWWAMGIRIDHALVTGGWRVIDARVGRDIGSDHLPIVATLQLVEATQASATPASAAAKIAPGKAR
ncbi:MAG TPA: endonuclease/exonuclease/phosphatase family protein [Tepidisphaeraceae bacterium]|jgi:endonuclease/exonuclease/phosphatase (EEP) superfamily protein YafD